MELGHRSHGLLISLVIASLMLAGCTGGASPPSGSQANPPAGGQSTTAPASGSSGGAVQLHYILWDSNQLPPYQQCADAFQKQNPNITIKIDQIGWGDYWTGLQTGFVSGNAPDVFTDHLAHLPEYIAKGQLVDLQPYVTRDNVNVGQYLTGLADLWVKEGKRYGLPKDWDTIAIVYNKDMLTKAGIDPATINDWTWNPQDGGTFEQAIAKLTLDKAGHNGLDPSFDKKNVVQYGFIHQGSGGAVGQTQWSMFAYSLGFKTVDQPWATSYHYDDPRLAQTMAWFRHLIDKGYSPTLQDVTSLGAGTLFQSGKGAMTTDGSWTINDYLKNTKATVGWGLLPKGSQGRKTMFNGLADSIWTGSQHKDEAWQWVKFLSSPDCENIVGDSGVVFPAIQSGVDKSLAAHKAKGADVSAYTDEAKDPNTTFLFPITDHATEISDIMGPAMDSILLGQADAATALKQANDKVNALFK